MSRSKSKICAQAGFDTEWLGHYDTAPMPKPPVDPVDVGLLTASRSAFAREYALADFARLGDGLAKREGRAEAEFRFHAADWFAPEGVSSEGGPEGAGRSAATKLPALEGVVRARPWLVCQRCLNAYEQPLESAFRIAFVATEDDTANVPEGYEGVAAPHGRAALADIVEDELLLALPLVPMHATSGECAAEPATAAPEEAAPREVTQRPFADLRSLLGKQSQ